ncbi:hypothetical protein OH492_01865 [Vibrio chagasii]|nr:hypothetical protein [Vibrio chagasii]
MASRQIPIQMSPEEKGALPLALDGQFQVETEAELNRFLSDNHKRYQAASWDMAETRKSHFHYPPNFMGMIKPRPAL